MRHPKIVVVLAAVATLTLAACTTSNTIEGQRVRAVADTVTERVEVSGGLHDRAPQWFKDYWEDYLNSAGGRYAVLALDRNALGVYYVWCIGPGCHYNETPMARSATDVHYKHRALKGCRQTVRDNYPMMKPDCAIYAIKNKIVWPHPFPWN